MSYQDSISTCNNPLQVEKNKTYTLEEIASHVGAQIQGGNGREFISGIAPLDTAEAGQITFLDNSRYRKYLDSTKASAVILSSVEDINLSIPILIHKNPYLAYAKVAELFAYTSEHPKGIHKTAVVEEGAIVATTASIGPYCYIAKGAVIGENTVLSASCIIGENVIIGKNCYLHPRVTLCHHTQVGNQVILHSGVVLGSDGFGNANDRGEWIKIPQLGRTLVGDKVEIGANTTVDRGALGDTIIEEGVRLDNQIQIGHNVRIGAHTAIAACTGVAGSTKIGKYCRIGGMVAFNGHLTIVDNVIVTGNAMVTGNVMSPGVYSSGVGLEPYEKWRRNAVRFKHLDELTKRVQRLEQQLLLKGKEENSQ